MKLKYLESKLNTLIDDSGQDSISPLQTKFKFACMGLVVISSEYIYKVKSESSQ